MDNRRSRHGTPIVSREDPLFDLADYSVEAGFCGVDEAGRGPLAGPVVAAAVMHEDRDVLRDVRDSKVLSPRKREELFARIVATLDYAVGVCTVEEIDELNILRASLRAMEKAVAGLVRSPTAIFVDGIHRLSLSIPSHAIVRGDSRVPAISAASIVAKVTRDRLMTEYDKTYPEYGFGKHFGYPTAAHRAALMSVGPCAIHRKTFRGVRELLQSDF